MRLLVASDSHKRYNNLLRAVEEQSGADYIIFLGDGEDDIDKIQIRFPDRKIIKVRGNCDWGSLLPDKALEILGGKRVYCTHGAVERVKSGTGELISRAKRDNADIVLYGHTHRPVTDYVEGMHIMNPGSIADGRYGFVDITDKGVICVLREFQEI